MKERLLTRENSYLIANTAYKYALNAIYDGEEGEYKLEEMAVILTEEEFNTIAYIKDLNESKVEVNFSEDIEGGCFDRYYNVLLSTLADDYNVITIKY